MLYFLLCIMILMLNGFFIVILFFLQDVLPTAVTPGTSPESEEMDVSSAVSLEVSLKSI